MRMPLFLIAGCVFLLAGGTVHAQGRDPATAASRELPAPPKVKSKGAVQTSAPTPATVQRDSTAKPAVPRKSKSASAATPRQQKKLPRAEKPAKPAKPGA
jgi:hypothetical protein